MIRVGSEFTKNQKFSIEELKEKRRKDHKVESFLAEQEKRPECRRLQVIPPPPRPLRMVLRLALNFFAISVAVHTAS